MTMNFNDAAPQSGPNTLIPDQTKAKVSMKVRPGGQGDGGWLKLTQKGDKLMLDVEFTVMEGTSAKRKFWELMIVEDKGNAESEAVNISRSRLRGLLESARSIKSNDQSEEAKQKRLVNGYGEFDGLEPYVCIKIEASKDPQYGDKNRLSYAITPDHKEWSVISGGAFNQVVGQGIKQVTNNPNPTKSGGKPSWAQ